MNFTEQEIATILLSLKIAFWAVFWSMPFGIIVAFVLARGNFWGKNILNILVHLPLVVPPVVTGYFLLIIFGRKGFLGEILNDYFGIVFSFRWTGAALACGIMGFPLMVRTIRLSIENIDYKLEFAAKTLGANSFWVFITITLPLIFKGVIAGVVLSFARALGEFGATIVFVSNIPNETQTLPMLIYTFTQIPNSDYMILRLSLISIFISALSLLLSEFIIKNDFRR